MRNHPSKENLGFDELAITNGKNLRVAKRAVVVHAQIVGDEHVLAIAHEMDERETGDCARVRPASREVGRSIEALRSPALRMGA